MNEFSCILQEFENTFANAGSKRGRLTQNQQHLSACVSAEDTGILQQRLSLLDTQWEEILHQVLLRKQRIQEKLSSWASFSSRYKELLGAMTTLEDKISTSKEFNIEDLLHKLQNVSGLLQVSSTFVFMMVIALHLFGSFFQDYREELRSMDRDRQWLFEEGERLMRASSDVRASDIELKMQKLQDKWAALEDKARSRSALIPNASIGTSWSVQHSFLLCRLQKLQDTLKTVQQLEHNMGKLRSWLAYVEHELSSPIVYQHCDFLEIQRKLTEQQVFILFLQASVLSLLSMQCNVIKLLVHQYLHVKSLACVEYCQLLACCYV